MVGIFTTHVPRPYVNISVMSHAIKSAAIAIFRPLVRFLIGHGWTYGAMAELLKVVCVEESCRRLASEASPLTDSKVGLISGIHRKEVNRIRLELAASTTNDLPLRQGANVAAQLIALWVTHPGFLDEHDQPLPLPMRAESGPSVDELARLIKADMRPRTILDDLIRAGIVEENAGLISLLRTTYVSDVPEDRLSFLGANVGDHLASAVYNLENDPPPFLDQAVYFDALSPEALDHVREDLRLMGNKMLRAAYQRISKLDSQTPAQVDTPSVCRMRLGVYYYEENTPTATSLPPTQPAGNLHE